MKSYILKVLPTSTEYSPVDRSWASMGLQQIAEYNKYIMSANNHPIIYNLLTWLNVRLRICMSSLAWWKKQRNIIAVCIDSNILNQSWWHFLLNYDSRNSNEMRQISLLKRKSGLWGFYVSFLKVSAYVKHN